MKTVLLFVNPTEKKYFLSTKNNGTAVSTLTATGGAGSNDTPSRSSSAKGQYSQGFRTF